MGDLHGKCALVTAGGQGIGRAISEHLVRLGCRVAVHYHNSREGALDVARLAQELDTECITLRGDLTKKAEAVSLVEETVKHFEGLHLLVNNAGSLVKRSTIDEIDEEFWQYVMNLNLTSMMNLTQAAVSALGRHESSSIVNIASLAGRKGGHPGSIAYATAKGAVITWTRALSTELAPRGIRVNAVAPGFIEGTSFHETHTTRESAAETIRGIPLGRAGNPADVARVVAFLCSEYDGFITGATIDVNGGVYFS